MSKKVISTDNKIQRSELSSPLTVPIGASYTELESGFNSDDTWGQRGFSSYSKSEVVVLFEVDGTMPAGTEVVLTPEYNTFGVGDTVTGTADEVTDGIGIVRIEDDAIRDSDFMKVTYRFEQGGASYDVTKVHIQVKKKDDVNGGGFSDPLTNNGDIIIRDSGVTTRLAVGSADQVLTVSGGVPSWANSAAGFSDPMTTRGDIIFKDASTTTTRLALGTSGQVLQSDGADLAYATLDASSISDFDTEVGNHPDVAANTSARHGAVTLAASATTGGMSLSTQEIGFQAAATGANGYLSSTDWNTFNGKLDDPMTTRGDLMVRDALNDTARLAIGTANQVLQSDGTDVSWATLTASDVSDFDTEVEGNTEVSANTAARHGAVTLAASATTGGLSLSTQEIGFQVATAVQNGYLSSTDFSTFDGKMTDPLTTNGDLVVRSGGSTTRLAVGTNDQVLTVVGGAVAWAAASGGFSDPMTTRGDIIIRDATNTTARLAVGTSAQVLQSDGTDITWQTLTASDVSDFDTEVSNNTDVAANTSARHGAVTLAASATTGGLTLSTQEIGFQVATAGQNGYLSSTDFSTFDGKLTDPLTTDGDLIVRDTSTTRLAVGSEDQVLTVVSGMPAWANASAGFTDPMTTRGDIIYRDATNTTTRLGVGTANQVLQTDGTDLAYATLTASDISDFQTTVSDNTDVAANTSARHAAVTLAASATTGGLSLSTQEIGFQVAGAIQNGYLSSTDWTTFNSKQDTITTGNLTEATSSVLTIVGGTDSILGSGVTIEVDQADGSNDGYVSSTDWTTFNNKSDYSDPLTTNGDILIRSGGATTRLAVGTNDQVLTVSGGAPTWAASASGFSDPMTTRGDIIIRDATNTTARLGIGTNTQVLTSDGTDISWATPSGGGTPAGSDEGIQYNASGSFGSESTFVYDYTNDRLGIGTASPVNTLHLTGSGDQAIRIEAGTGGQADIYCICDVAAYTRAGGFRVYNDSTDIGFIGVYADNSTTAGKFTIETRENAGNMHLRLTIDEDGDLQFNPLLRDSNFQVSTDDRSYGLWVDGGNDCVGIGTNSFGSSAVGSLGIAIGTEPTSAVAGQIEIYAKDSSDGTANATLGIRTEQSVESIGTFTASHKGKIWWNGDEYWVQLDAV